MMLAESDLQPRRRTKRVAAVVAGVLSVGGLAGGGVWLASFLATGPQPAEALPAGTLAYAAIDVDPSGGQKIDAVRFMRKFPAEARPGSGSDDLRRAAFDLITDDGPCRKQWSAVEGWIGDRMAVALLDAAHPTPVVVLEVDGHDGVDKGLDALSDCIGGLKGHAVEGSWAVLASTDAAAKKVLADAATSSLADSSSFKTWTGKAGGTGLVTLYAGPEAGDAAATWAEKSPEAAFIVPALVGGTGAMSPVFGLSPMPALGMVAPPTMEMNAQESHRVDEGDFEMKPLTKAEEKKLRTMTPEEQEAFFEKRFPAPEPDRIGTASSKSGDDFEGDFEGQVDAPKVSKKLLAALRSFDGLGGSLRFEDDALQLTMVADHIDAGGDLTAGTGADRLLSDVPSDLAGAYAATLAPDWTETVMASFTGMGGPMEESQAEMERSFEKETGLAFPEDVKTLGGTGVTLVAGPDFPTDDQAGGSVPIAAVLHGDASRIEAALAKISAGAVGHLVWKADGDKVVVGVDRDFVSSVLAGKGLPGSSTYAKLLPDAKAASGALFVNFDADGWLARVVGKHDRASAEPLDALGVTFSRVDGEDRTKARLTTD